jgi:replicative DNA helicase
MTMDANAAHVAGLPVAAIDADPIKPSTEQLDKLCVSEVLTPIVERIKQGTTRVSTGIDLLDKILRSDRDSKHEKGGFVLPSLVVLGAGPKVGKTSLSQGIAEHFVKQKRYVLYIDLENGRERFWRRMFCRMAEVGPGMLSPDAAKMGMKDLKNWEKAQIFWTQEAKNRFFYEDNRNHDPNGIRQLIQQVVVKSDGAPVLVVIDSLQKLKMSMKERRDGIDEWVRELESMRNEMNVVILVISELNRASYAGAGGTKAKAAFKESGDIEYTADLALHMSRDDNDKDDTPAEMVVMYDRDGAYGRVGYFSHVRPYYGIKATPEKSG